MAKEIEINIDEENVLEVNMNVNGHPIEFLIEFADVTSEFLTIESESDDGEEGAQLVQELVLHED